MKKRDTPKGSMQMPVRCVTYNIQYGIGMDGRYELARIAEAVRDADIIALQEVSRGSPWNAFADMTAELALLFPDRFAAWHFPVDTDLGSIVENGRKTERRFQFGNGVLSRWPIIGARGHLLPRRRVDERLNLQRGALEAVIGTPAGVMRFYSVHLDHIDPQERLDQLAVLKRIALDFSSFGGAISGVSSLGFADPPSPDEFILMGDFNFEPGSVEYRAMLDDGAVVDVSAKDQSLTYFDPKGQEKSQRLDFCFASSDLADRILSTNVDGDAVGSDHRPVWVTIG
jgi:endonuclease/exonuclease/phosphatase family metal-dependent hydrolase